MYYRDLKKISEAPDQGQMLAYTRKQVIFQPYANPDEVKQMLADEQILELHLFDRDREYRAITSHSPRFEGGVIETIADFPAENENETYEDTVALEKEFGTAITVLNHIHYDENGMADIDNYRLRMWGMK